MQLLPASDATLAPRRVSRSSSRPAPVRSGFAVEVVEVVEVGAVTPYAVAGRVVVAGLLRRVEAAEEEVVVPMVWRLQAAEVVVGARCRVEGEVAAPGSSRSGQAVACPRQFIVRVTTQLEAILME